MFLDEHSRLGTTILELRNQVLDNPTKFLDDYLNDFYSPISLKLNEKIILGVLHWYFPEEIKFLFNLWLDENWGGEFKEIKAQLLHSKDFALGYLLVSDRFNEFDFFGNLLTQKILDRFCHFKFKKKKKRKLGIIPINFCDYKDKGSKPPDCNPEPVYDYRKLRTVDEQLELEIELNVKIDRLRLLIITRLEQEIS
jgi:hypothetical protein